MARSRGSCSTRFGNGTVSTGLIAGLLFSGATLSGSFGLGGLHESVAVCPGGQESTGPLFHTTTCPPRPPKYQRLTFTFGPPYHHSVIIWAMLPMGGWAC
jgi:hypothetical protein